MLPAESVASARMLPKGEHLRGGEWRGGSAWQRGESLILRVSPASMDRLLSEVRLVARGGRRRRAGFSSPVRRSVPVRTFGDWNDPPPGFVEVDFGADSGTSSLGRLRPDTGPDRHRDR